MTELKEVYTFQNSKHQPITIYFDPNGQFISSNSDVHNDGLEMHASEGSNEEKIQEPSFNFRLWGSSSLLSKYLESDFCKSIRLYHYHSENDLC